MHHNSIRGRAVRRAVRRAMSLMEILVVLTIMGILVSLAVTRYAEQGDDAKANACEVNRRNIEVQAQMWLRNKGVWPAADLADIGTDTAYLPDGLPACPVDGSSYTFNSVTETVDGHAH